MIKMTKIIKNGQNIGAKFLYGKNLKWEMVLEINKYALWKKIGSCEYIENFLKSLKNLVQLPKTTLKYFLVYWKFMTQNFKKIEFFKMLNFHNKVDSRQPNWFLECFFMVFPKTNVIEPQVLI